MEEILASIRRIIADDDASKVAPRAPEPPIVSAWPDAPPQSYADPAPLEIRHEEPADPVGPSLEEQASDILDLTESMAAPSPPFSEPKHAVIQPPMPNPAPAPQIHSFERYADEPKPATHKPAEASPTPAPEQLLSSATSAAVDSAFNALAQTVLVQNGRTLDDLVREMLRPMLKSWLDDNLPGLVERLVRNEIERVARGR